MITAIVDLQFGSTGKGLIAGYLSQRNEYDIVVSANMPNAGHTFVDSDGKKWVSKVLPSGVYSNKLAFVCVGPGAVFDVEQLRKEIEQLREQGITCPVVVHPNAAILMPAHREAEGQLLNHISSTMQGSMEAMYHKLLRRSETGSNIAQDHRRLINAAGAMIPTNYGWDTMMDRAENILMEGSQGYSLGINAGFYPYCTSRDCTVWRLISDSGVVMNNQELRVIGTARVHPIRVGNTEGGTSGPCYPDQEELTWEQIGQTPEMTTVTGRVRRVFSFSKRQIRDAMYANKVDEVFLNFANYDPRAAAATVKHIDEIGKQMKEARGVILWSNKPKTVRYVGFGPQAEDIIERGEE